MMNLNTKCPRPLSHLENAIDQHIDSVPDGALSTSLAEAWNKIEANAQYEIDHCEGFHA